MLGTCKTCVFWGTRYYMFKEPYRVCEAVGLREASEPRTQFTVDVRVDDDSGLETDVKTGPDFGCVLHKQA